MLKMSAKDENLKSGRLVWQNLIAWVVGVALLALVMTLLAGNYFAGQNMQIFLALLLFALVVLLGVALLVHLNLRNARLRAKVEIDEKKEAQLWIEIDHRREAEVRLKEYQDSLERIVEERTRELKKTQNVLLEQAVETGRSQLAAMVLHNIGNAITPVVIHIEELKAKETDQLYEYLHKCYLELCRHSGDLTRFVNEDERGREVFNYFSKLLELLAEKKRERKIILDEMDGAVNMVAEIIRLQQLYASGPDEHRELVDINTVLQDALRMQAGALTKRGIEVKVKLTGGLSKLMIDKNRFLQVLVNLLKNGYEAIETLSLAGAPDGWKKVITISSQVKVNHVYLEISDTGIGINSPEKEKLFEFGRSHKGSSGFGLYYCKQFIEKNQGSIAIESHGSGQGALVRIILPIGKNDD